MTSSRRCANAGWSTATTLRVGRYQLEYREPYLRINHFWMSEAAMQGDRKTTQGPVTTWYREPVAA